MGRADRVEWKRKLNLGCGPGAPVLDEWMNLDGSWNAWLAKHSVVRQFLRAFHLLPESLLDMPWRPDVIVHDVIRTLPFQDNSLDGIYASHILEHLYLDEAKQLLQECFRVLRPNGVLRVVVPDLRAIALEYLGSTTIDDSSDRTSAELPADRMNKRLGFRPPARPTGNVLRQMYIAVKDFHTHKWMYDADSLAYYLRGVGFDEVQEMPFCVSRIDDIQRVEQVGRVLNGAGVCVEGVKLTKTDVQAGGKRS